MGFSQVKLFVPRPGPMTKTCAKPVGLPIPVHITNTMSFTVQYQYIPATGTVYDGCSVAEADPQYTCIKPYSCYINFIEKHRLQLSLCMVCPRMVCPNMGCVLELKQILGLSNIRAKCPVSELGTTISEDQNKNWKL